MNINKSIQYNVKHLNKQKRLASVFCLQASQKGAPLAALKKQLEEKEKLLSAEQENSTAAKTRIRELTKVSIKRMKFSC